jgi:putative hydrolase of the HAD superfamily
MSDDRPSIEPLTPEEKERFLSRARAQGRSLSAEEQYAIFGPPPEHTPVVEAYRDVEEMEAAPVDADRMARLEANFFVDVEGPQDIRPPRLVRGVIFDLDNTLAHLARPLDDLMAEGARAADAYLRSTGMTLPDDFATHMVEARRFAEKKSADEQEEHIADDALSFLLQFFGYPASRMDPVVLQRAVDIFYAPEMTAWRLVDGARQTLQSLRAEGYKLALLANYNCERVFQRTIDYLGLRADFDVCLCSASVEYRKPDTRFFQIALDHWDMLAYEVVVVGDSLLHEIKGGIDLGTMTVQVNGATTAQVMHDNAVYAARIVPDATITHLDQLVPLVLEWS